MIRSLRSDDYPGLVRLLRTLRADNIYTPTGMRHLIESMPERASNAAWVADEGELVGWGWAHRRWHRGSNTAFAWVGVLGEARGRGLGTELWQLAETHAASLDVATLFTDVVGDPAGERFVARRGFTPSRIDVVSAVDVQAVDLSELHQRERAATKNGYRLTTFREVELHDLYRLDAATANDMPGADAAAAEHGIETIITDNAEQNVGMLAINKRLGYRPIVERRRWRKE